MRRHCQRVGCTREYVPDVDRVKTFSCYYCPECKAILDSKDYARRVERLLILQARRDPTLTESERKVIYDYRKKQRSKLME